MTDCERGGSRGFSRDDEYITTVVEFNEGAS